MNIYLLRKNKNQLLSNGCKQINSYAFAGYPNLTTVEIKEGVTEIGPGAFAACPNLHTVILPKSLKIIGSEAFSNCENLESVIFYEHSHPNKGITLFPKKYYGVEEIGKYAFSGCSQLTSFKLPQKLKEVAIRMLLKL